MGLVAGCTLLQHWMGPVLHCEGGGVGVAVTVVVVVGELDL